MKQTGELSTIHHTYKSDFLLLFEQLEINLNDQAKYQSYYRTAILMFFNLIEADLFYYNQFDPYDGYEDATDFSNKFKGTFRKICTTWDKKELQKIYFDKHLQKIKELKNIRNRLTHPKSINDLYKADMKDVDALKEAFVNYDDFINNIMENFTFSGQISTENLNNLLSGLIFIK